MTPPEPAYVENAPAAGALCGLLLGVVDFGTCAALGVTFEVNGHDVLLVVATVFTINFVFLGYIIGRLAKTRARLVGSNRVIEAQLRDLEAKQQQLLQAEKLAAIGRMAAGVAHEVRNPLGVIRASAALAAEDSPDASDSRLALTFVIEEVDRLNAFVTELLDFSRPVTPALEARNLEDIIQTATRIAEQAIAGRAVACDVDFQTDQDLARIDPDLLTRALSSLIINAAQAATPEQGHVLIRVSRRGEHVLVDVIDDGPGVNADLEDQIFEPFYTTKPDGTGLGLAMAAKLVALQGGTLDLVPGVGLGPSGACFRLALRGAS